MVMEMTSILICDDERDIVNALKIYLSGEGYEIYEAYTGLGAIDAVKKNDIHLILMDIMMPGMDGISATVSLRQITNAPIILLTAKSEDTDKVLGLNVGADDYITKPFNPVEVIARVKSQMVARPIPPAMAAPLTAAIVGLDRSYSVRSRRAMRSESRRCSWGVLARSVSR